MTTVNTCFNIIEYAKRCDVVFMRDMAAPFIKNNTLNDIKNGSLIYCWSTYLEPLFNFLKTTSIKDITLLSGDNDHCVNPNGCITTFPHDNFATVYTPIAPKNIKKWYAQNAQVVNDFITPLPIGLRPPWVETVIFDNNGIKKFKFEYERDQLIYSNFNKSTNPIQRKQVEEILTQNFNINTLYGDSTEYCKNLQKHKFVACPPGNGKDTHRVWESLYFGAIPIVEDSPMNRYFSLYFPMLVVDRWVDLSVDFLNSEYERIKNSAFDSKLLDLDNWFNLNQIKSIGV